VKPGPDETELLQYLADLGWSDLYLPAGSRAPSGAPPPEAPLVGKEAKASSKGDVRVASPGSSPAAAAGAPSSSAAAVLEPSRPALVRLPEAEVVAEFSLLAAKVAGCRECKLCTTRTQTVFASGDPRARLMLIGEGPGADEDASGLPFVGRDEVLRTVARQHVGPQPHCPHRALVAG